MTMNQREGVVMFCSKCGNQLNDGDSYCPKCGSPVGKKPKKPFFWIALGAGIMALIAAVIIGCILIFGRGSGDDDAVVRKKDPDKTVSSDKVKEEEGKKQEVGKNENPADNPTDIPGKNDSPKEPAPGMETTDPVIPVFQFGASGNTAWVYDEKGRLEREIGCCLLGDGRRPGVLNLYYSYEYDRDGRLITEKMELLTGQGISTWYKYFYEDSDTISVEVYDNTAQEPRRARAKTDAGGNIILVEISDSGEWREIERAEYDGEGKILKRFITTGMFSMETTYRYNAGKMYETGSRMGSANYEARSDVKNMKLSEYLALRKMTEKELAGEWELCPAGNSMESIGITLMADGTGSALFQNSSGGAAAGSDEPPVAKTEEVRQEFEFSVSDGILTIMGVPVYFFTEKNFLYFVAIDTSDSKTQWGGSSDSTSARKSVTIEVIDRTGGKKGYAVMTTAQTLRQLMEETKDLDFSGQESVYGMTVENVNGQVASTAEGAYWAFYVNGDYCVYGIDEQPVADGDIFRIVYETY